MTRSLTALAPSVLAVVRREANRLQPPAARRPEPRSARVLQPALASAQLSLFPRPSAIDVK
jgi:hypothetical protein